MVDENEPLRAAAPLRLSLVTLAVADVARSTRFYEALGLVRSSQSSETVSFLEAGGVVLSIYERQALADDAGIAPDGSGFRAASLAWNVGSEQEVDKAIVRIVAAGGGLVKSPEETFWGGYCGYATDPNGHLWEVAHNPAWPLGPDGALLLPG